MKARLVKFGEFEVEGKRRYRHDVVIDSDKMRKRKKGRAERRLETGILNANHSIACYSADEQQPERFIR